MSLPPVAPETTPSAGQTPERWFAEQVHAHDRSLKVWRRSSYPAIRNLSVNNVFNSPRVLLRCGSQTPDYARAYQRDEYGTRVAVGLKGTY